MVAGRFVASVCALPNFCFLYGETAAAEEEVEKGCEHEGLRLEMDLMALVPWRMGNIFDAMVMVFVIC